MKHLEQMVIMHEAHVKITHDTKQGVLARAERTAELIVFKTALGRYRKHVIVGLDDIHSKMLFPELRLLNVTLSEPEHEPAMTVYTGGGYRTNDEAGTSDAGVEYKAISLDKTSKGQRQVSQLFFAVNHATERAPDRLR